MSTINTSDRPPGSGQPRGGAAPPASRSKVWPTAVAVVIAAVAFTAAYSRRAPDASAAAVDDAELPVQRSLTTSPPAAAASTLALDEQPRVAVTFRLDPAVTRGLYLGERWVSPPVFRFAQPGDRYVVQARLQEIDSAGEAIDLNGNWAASDPGMVAIERGAHGIVTLVVHEAGRSRVTVTSGNRSAVLDVEARRTADAMDVSIRQ